MAGKEASGGLSTGKMNLPCPLCYGSALGVDVGNSRSSRGTGNSGVIITLPWVVRNQGALQVAVPGSQSHGMQLPQERQRDTAGPWCDGDEGGTGRARSIGSSSGGCAPGLEEPVFSIQPFWVKLAVLKSQELALREGLGSRQAPGRAASLAPSLPRSSSFCVPKTVAFLYPAPHHSEFHCGAPERALAEGEQQLLLRSEIISCLLPSGSSSTPSCRRKHRARSGGKGDVPLRAGMGDRSQGQEWVRTLIYPFYKRAVNSCFQPDCRRGTEG